jgi:2-polyprenyl-3-methyl-5-hydroxy-6-metoxy-1,4-benzoquinol methylase
MEYKRISCDLCGSGRSRRIASCRIGKNDADLPLGSMDIVRCRDCGLVFVNPRPEYTGEEFDKLYSEEYFSAPYMRFYGEGGGEQTNEPFRSRLDWIEEHKKRGRLLDIGCASGGFLLAAKERGWDVYGVEASKTASKMARERHKLNVTTGMIYEAGLKDGFFDVVTASDVMEHVESPRAFLKEINRILRPGGLLYIAVPDFDGLYYSAALALSRFSHRNYFVLPHHVYFFDRRTARRYLREAGFSVLDERSSEANISKRGLRGKVMLLLFVTARLFRRQDRALFLAKKNM